MSGVDQLHIETKVLKVREHSELLSVHYLARCLEPGNVSISITTMDTPKRWMKATLFTRHRGSVEPMMVAKDRIATLRAIHTGAVNQAVNRQEVNVVLDDRPHMIDTSEGDITRRERTTLAQLRSGHCILLGSYKSGINTNASLNVCADCGRTPHDVNHLFNTTLTPSNIWSRSVDAIRELSYLEAG